MKSLLSVWLMLLVPLPALAPTCPFPPLPQRADSTQEDGVEPSGSAESASASPQAAREIEGRAWLPVAAVVGSCPYALLPGPQEFPHEAAAEARGSTEAAPTEEGAPEAERPAWVNPNFINKKVVVYLRDGRVYKGKLLELTEDSLRLKMGKRTEKIPLTEVGSVERKRSRAWLAVAIAGLAIGAVAVGALIAAMQD